MFSAKKQKSKSITKSYTVTLKSPKGKEKNLQVYDNEYINDAASREGINLPASCNAGKCVSCTAKLVKGDVVNDHTFLTSKEEAAGFILTCRSIPTSDCVILTHQEDALFDL